MEGTLEPLLMTPIESNYKACTIPYRFPSDNPRKPTPTEIAWIDLFLNSIPSFKKRAESDATVNDAPAKAELFAQRYFEILEDLKKDPESHGCPPDCILLCRLRELILRELGFRDILKKVKDEENAKAKTLFENVVELNDAIEEEGKRVEKLVRGIFAGNIFDIGSAQGPVLAGNRKLIGKKLAEEDAESQVKGEAKNKQLIIENRHVVKPINYDLHEKFLITLATRGVVTLFNVVSKAQNAQT